MASDNPAQSRSFRQVIHDSVDVIANTVAYPFSYFYSKENEHEDSVDSNIPNIAVRRRLSSRIARRPSTTEVALDEPSFNQDQKYDAFYETTSSGATKSFEDPSMLAINGLRSSSSPESIFLSHASNPTEYSLQNFLVPGEPITFFAGLQDSAFPRRQLMLPKKAKILVLDLDETLVHSTSKSSSECDFMVEVLMERSSCLYYVFKRPHVEYFLQIVSSWYHLVIYTASMREYADPVVDWLDSGRKLFRKRLFRTACAERDGMYLKDLTLVDADLGRMCLLDNSPCSFVINPDNAIPIDGWICDQRDTALLDLLPFLDALRFVDDIRSILSLRRL